MQLNFNKISGVEGFIQMDFANVTAKGYSYGSGAITDGKYELVCIPQFTVNSALIDGTHVSI